MAREAFKTWRPRDETLAKVMMCQRIVTEYQRQGLILTLRQLYYQFVARDLIPNTERSYKGLGSAVSNARLAGMLDWDAIEDRGRRPDIPLEFVNLDHRVESALYNYRLDRWEGQPCYAELWVEKAALAGVLEPLASEFHVPLMVNKGYSSQSAMYESAQRIYTGCTGLNPRDIPEDENPRDYEGFREGYILYLGDHDPSGQDMVRDIRERLNTFTRYQLDLEVRTVALITSQVRQYDPPPNPTKITDSRAKTYIRDFGHECWEVDALDPATLQQLIRDELESLIDENTMDAVKEREEADKRRLREAVQSL